MKFAHQPIIVLTILSTLLFANSIRAQIFTGPGFTVVDGGGRVSTSCSTINVSGITGSRIVRAVTLDSTNHSWIGDTEARLYPPGAAPPPSLTSSFVITSPPDGRACNYAGTYRFTDLAVQSVDAATVGCADATNVAPGDYRTSNYGGGTNPGVVTSIESSFGVLSPAQTNGNWLVCVFDFAAPDGGTVGSTSLQLVAPTAASVSLSGRVTTASGRGIGNVFITINDAGGNARTAITNPFGFYRFDGVQVGQNYLISAASKRYTFESPTVVHHAADDYDGINFVANP